MAQNPHHTRSKNDKKLIRSLSDPDADKLSITTTSGTVSSSKPIISKTVKIDIDAISNHSPSSSPSKHSDHTDAIFNQQQILNDYQHIKMLIQQQEVNMNKLIQLYDQLSIRNTTVSLTNSTASAVTTDPATKQLRSKQINQLFESTPFSRSRSQDVMDWLDEFNRKCDDIKLDDSQRFSIARELMINDAKLWSDTLKNRAIDWKMFQQKLISHFQLSAGIDCFSFSQQLYSRQQQLHESAIRYYHDVMRLCSKVDLNMDNDTRLKHLYRGLRRETKINVDLQNLHTPDDFLHELVRLEYLQMDFENDGGQPFEMMTYPFNLASVSNSSLFRSSNEPFHHHHQKQHMNQPQQQQRRNQQYYQHNNQYQQHHRQQQYSSATSSHQRKRTYPSTSSSQYRNDQDSTSQNTNYYLNRW